MRPLAAYARVTVLTRLTWRGDWLLTVFAHALSSFAGLLVVWAMYRNASVIAGHTQSDALLVWGFAMASQGLFWTLFGGVFVANRRYLVGGDLDRLLLRPIDPLLQLLLDHIKPEHLASLLLGLGVILTALWGRADVAFVHLLAIPAQVALGSLLIAGLLLSLASLGFWMQHRGSAVGLASEMAGYAAYPLSFLPDPLALLMVTLVPFAFTAAAPASLFMHQPRWGWLWMAQPVVCLAVAAAGLAMWKLSLHRYSSAGS